MPSFLKESTGPSAHQLSMSNRHSTLKMRIAFGHEVGGWDQFQAQERFRLAYLYSLNQQREVTTASRGEKVTYCNSHQISKPELSVLDALQISSYSKDYTRSMKDLVPSGLLNQEVKCHKTELVCLLSYACMEDFL